MSRDFSVVSKLAGVARIFVWGDHSAMHQRCTRLKLLRAAGVRERSSTVGIVMGGAPERNKNGKKDR